MNLDGKIEYYLSDDFNEGLAGTAAKWAATAGEAALAGAAGTAGSLAVLKLSKKISILRKRKAASRNAAQKSSIDRQIQSLTAKKEEMRANK